MPEVVVASDAPWVIDEVRAAVEGPELSVRTVAAGVDVLPAVRRRHPDVVVLDLQIGNMGGMASCLDLRLEEGAGRLDHMPVLMLLDRRADVFLARRSGAEGWLLKPLDPIRLGGAVRALLAGETWHDPTDTPPASAAPQPVR